MKRNIIVVGQQKTGTTGVYSLIKSALAPIAGEYFFSFEPSRQEPLDRVRRNDPTLSILTKIMYKNVSSFTMTSFDKRVMTVRDPRDTIISTLLFKPMIRKVVDQVPLTEHERFIAALEQKERDPRGVSVVELMELAADVGYRRHHPRRNARELVEMSNFARAEHFHVVRYEDFVDGDVNQLADYLELPLDPGAAQTANWLAHISRSRAHGAWRHWFTEGDVDYYRPLLSRCMARMGYADDWELAASPRIPADSSSDYVRRALHKRRQELSTEGGHGSQGTLSLATLHSMASDGNARAALELSRRLSEGTDYGASWPVSAQYWARRAELQGVPSNAPTRDAGGGGRRR